MEEEWSAAAGAGGTGWSESSHCHHWLFSSPEQLQQQRQLYHARYVQQLQAQARAQAQAQATAAAAATQSDAAPTAAPAHAALPPSPSPLLGPSSTATSAVGGRRKERRAAASAASAAPLTLSEQSVLVLYYQLTIGSLSARFTPPLPAAVQCTAQLYLHRFYTRHSPQSYHPKQVVLTALLLACKVEEHYVSAAKLAEKASKGGEQQRGGEEKAAEIVRLEVPLLEGIGFHLRCHHPHRAVRGLVRRTAEREGWTAERRREVEERSLSLVQAAYLTDAVLLHSPSHLSLAAVSLSLEQLQLPPSSAEALLDVAFPPSSPLPSVLHSRLSSVRSFLLAGAAVVAADVRREAALIDAKLMRCRDRSNDPTSDEWKERERRRAEEKERRREEKGKKRAEEERQRLQDLTMGSAGEIRGGEGGGEADDDDFFIIKRRRVEDGQ